MKASEGIELLLRKAYSCIDRKDYPAAEKIAMQMEENGYLMHSSCIYNRMRNFGKVRELTVKRAKELCAKGMHRNEAMHYRSIGMFNEYLFALEEHRLEYEIKYRGRKMD